MTLKNFKIALLTFVMCLHITDVFSQEALVPEFEIYNAFPYLTNMCNSPIVELESGDFIVSYCSYSDGSNNTSSVQKISSDGVIVSDLTLAKPDNYMFSQPPFVVNTENNGLYVVGSHEPVRYLIDDDEAAIFIKRIDENLNLLESHEHNIKIDTSSYNPAGSIAPYDSLFTRIMVFSVFEAEGGIWACFLKRVPINVPFPGVLGNDSILFWKFDYEGNKIDSKYMELNGWENIEAFIGNKVRMTDSGYDLFLPCLRAVPPGGSRQFVIQSYDKDFNFIGDVERLHSNPDCYYDASVKALSPDNTAVASWYVNVNNPKLTGLSLTIFDNNLHKVKEKVYWGIEGWDEFSGQWSSVDFIDENRIFWAYTDHYSMAGNHDYDSWLGINLLTADLEIEHTYFYDMYGEKSWMQLSATKATRDGGLLLTGQINGSINVYPTKEDCFAVKFPAEAFLGIDEAHKYGLKTAVAYPNPGRNELNIKTGLENARIEVYNVQGGRVFESEAADKVTTIDASGWNSGIYLWKVMIDGKEVESGKWVKE